MGRNPLPGLTTTRKFMNSIPASQLVQINPSVVGTGGNPLSLSTVILTEDTSIPIGTVRPFTSADSVKSWFGETSPEGDAAIIYFLGFDKKTITPSTLWFSQYPTANVAAYLRSGKLAMTLQKLQTFSGTIAFVVNGASQTSSAINLSAATSFSNAASLIQAACTGITCAYDVQRDAFVITSTLTGVASTMTYCTTGTLANNLMLTEALGAVLSQGANAATNPATYAQLTSGSFNGVSINTVKTYSGTLTCVVDGISYTSSTITLSGASTYADVATLIADGFTSTPVTVTWDSVNEVFVMKSVTAGVNSSIGFCTGTVSTNLKFTAAAGAMNIQGTPEQLNPNATLDNICQVTQNWICFMTMWEPNTIGKIQFADWSNSKNQRYLYVSWDTDITAESSNATETFGRKMILGNYDGVCCCYPRIEIAAFICGTIASINFSSYNGRITLAFKGQSGLTADILDADTAENLIGNGYNFYGSWATANDFFVNLQPGMVPGKWKWADSYANQVYMSNQFQLALMSLLTSVNSLPYNSLGYSMVRAALQDPINEGVNFGSIRTGVPLSEQQRAIVNMAAGVDISVSLNNRGYYLQVLPATAQKRGLRQSPPINFWYMDGGAIQKIVMASIDVQ